MLITMIDDSIPFDGNSPATRPLGGPQKGFASLPGAFAARGHTVRVFNRCDVPAVVADVSWQNIDDCEVGRSDWLIVHRRPELIALAPEADRHAVWIAGPPDYLARAEPYSILQSYKPMLVMQSLAHTAHMPASLQTQRSRLVVPGVGEVYRKADEGVPAAPAHAVTTTHPLAGLDWLLDLWVESVFPRVPWAELHIYSAILERGAGGAAVPDAVQPVLDRALAAARQGVRLFAPLADPGMVEVYRGARVHLYPGHKKDVLCTTLAESQAVGLPAVARRLGAAAERVRDGITGQIAPDDEAFANLAVRLLDDDPTFRRLSGGARMGQRGRGWDAAAADFEKALA